MNLKQIIEYLFYLFVFLLPWQTRWIVQAGQLNGGYWEYGTYSLYATDILFLIILGLFLVWRIKSRKITNYKLQITNKSQAPNSKSQTRLPAACLPARQVALAKAGTSNLKFLTLGFLVIGLLSIYWAPDKLLAGYWYLRLLQGIIVCLLVINFSFKKHKIVLAFVLGAVIQSCLAISQFWQQTIIGNKWLGMSNQLSAVGGVSVIENISGRWLRAYGALPHPNILAGYLVVSLLFLIGLTWLADKRYQRLVVWSSWLIITVALFFTFSRAAILGFILGLLIFWFIGFKQKEIKLLKNLIILTVLLLIVFGSLGWLFSEPFLTRLTGQGRLEIQSTSQRLDYYKEAKGLIKNNWYKGVGLGNYTLAIKQQISPNKASYEYQPVHNVYLLILVELSVFGFIIFLIIIQQILAIGYRRLKTNLGMSNSVFNISALVVFIAILFIFFFDHYWWTLSFGLISFWLVVGISVKNNLSS